MHTASPFNNHIWLVLKFGKKDYNFNAVAPTIKALIPNIIEITAFIQSANYKSSAVTDLVNILCSVPILIGSPLQFAFIF